MLCSGATENETEMEERGAKGRRCGVRIGHYFIRIFEEGREKELDELFFFFFRCVDYTACMSVRICMCEMSNASKPCGLGRWPHFIFFFHVVCM